MKKFAFFLPQFYTIPENDKWWGKGFTEWTNVNAARPLFRNHMQPIHPLGDNYYCLLERKTVEWQTNLMRQYGIDGLIYYHYYFCGKKLLERPAENLLSWTDINQKFFFCWANHNWNRSWEGKKEILLKQEYGDVNDWEEHFQYLLPFFKDARYEKKDGKPLFMVFTSEFAEKNEMFRYFNKRSIEEGFNGLLFIESFSGGSRKKYNQFWNSISVVTEKVFYREPNVSNDMFGLDLIFLPRRICRSFIRRVIHKTDILWRVSSHLLYKYQMKEKKKNEIIHGIHMGFDNTPRHRKRGTVIDPPSKKDFFELMEYYADEEYLFFNAWNEWAEGMILEPTEEWGYRYLNWIKEWSELSG